VFKNIFRKVTEVVLRRPTIGAAEIEALEEELILQDLSYKTATKLIESLKANRGEIRDAEGLKASLENLVAGMLEVPGTEVPNISPLVYLFVGVNGTGKTTSIAKLAYWLKSQGKGIVLAAADTFRAAAIDQLQVWAERVGVPCVAHKEGADPAAVVFDAVASARSRGADHVLADTAGRQHTKHNLMEELKKISRVVERETGFPPAETLLVLDATAGQNAIQQARMFNEAVKITGLILTKTDGTASGGAILTIADELQIPVKYVGFGEQVDKFKPFNAREFARELARSGS
jgi:fused signal recognition particle receptor